ncbi:hypothetical protein GGI05_007746, partial [Coemansia sp. RSA 2603]
MDIRGHLSPRLAESRNSSSRTSTSTDASSSSYAVGNSENSVRSNEVVSRDTDAGINCNSLYSASTERSPHVPPPLDVAGARRSGAGNFFRSRYSRHSDGSVSDGPRNHSIESPADTLVSHGPLRVVSTKAATHQTEYLPTTPLTGDDNDSGSQAARLQEVNIPTGDLGVLLKTWSFVGDGSLAFTVAASPHSSTVDVVNQPNNHT